MTAPASTATPSVTPVRPTPTASPAPGGVLRIDRVAVAPNPDPTRVLLQMEGPADWGEIQVWSVAFKRVLSLATGPLESGWVSVPLPPAALRGLPNGLYYLTLRVGRGTAQTASRPLVFVIQK